MDVSTYYEDKRKFRYECENPNKGCCEGCTLSDEYEYNEVLECCEER